MLLNYYFFLILFILISKFCIFPLLDEVFLNCFILEYHKKSKKLTENQNTIFARNLIIQFFFKAKDLKYIFKYFFIFFSNYTFRSFSVIIEEKTKCIIFK